MEKRNFNRECVQIGSGPESAAALAAGEADVVGNIYNNVFPLIDNGLDVVVFLESLLYNLFDVIVHTEFAEANGISADKSVQENMEALDCSNVGVVARGAAAEDLARILIADAGLDPECFTYIAVGLDPVAPMVGGETDWTVTFDPFQVVLEAQGFGMSPFSIQKGDAGAHLAWPGLVYTTGRDTFNAHPEWMCAIKSAHNEAVAWLADPANTEAAVAIANTQLPEALHPLTGLLITKYQNGFSPTSNVQTDKVEGISQISIDVGKTSRLIGPDEFVTEPDCE
jgi:ABC-type nitrate/sulfonate/bicarbonate transport system substrate-binding protein